VACGLGAYILAATCVVLALIILFLLGMVERFYPLSAPCEKAPPDTKEQHALRKERE
jgi:hypothetical protein